MAISDHLIEEAIDAISDIQGIQMNPNELVDDVILVAYVFDDEPLFMSAIAQITHKLKLLIRQRNAGQALVGNYAGWWSFHFQSRKVNGHPADLRIVYQDIVTAILIRGFGHRHLPQSVYDRLKGR